MLNSTAVRADPATRPTDDTGNHPPSRWLILTRIGLIVAWLGCYFPWTATRGAAFTVNLFDLAEWTSLDSAVRYGSPPLLPTFLLRLTVGLIAVIIALHAVQTRSIGARRVLIGLALLIGIGLLPPIAFFSGQSGDANYRQQFVIALATCVVVFNLWLLGQRLSHRIVARATVIGLVLALITGTIGWLTGVNALSAFQIHLSPGYGLLIALASWLLAGVSAAIDSLRR